MPSPTSRGARFSIAWTMDPKHPRGLAVLEASSENEVRERVPHDPAVAGGVFQWTIEGFSELAREAFGWLLRGAQEKGRAPLTIVRGSVLIRGKMAKVLERVARGG